MGNFISVLCGFVIPGTGQMLNKQYLHGGIVLIFCFSAVTFSSFFFHLEWFVSGFIYLLFSLYSAIDAWIYSPKGAQTVEKQLTEFSELEKEMEEKRKAETEAMKEKLTAELISRYGKGKFEITRIEKQQQNWRAIVRMGEKVYEVALSKEGKIIS